MKIKNCWHITFPIKSQKIFVKLKKYNMQIRFCCTNLYQSNELCLLQFCFEYYTFCNFTRETEASLPYLKFCLFNLEPSYTLFKIKQRWVVEERGTARVEVQLLCQGGQVEEQVTGSRLGFVWVVYYSSHFTFSFMDFLYKSHLKLKNNLLS